MNGFISHLLGQTGATASALPVFFSAQTNKTLANNANSSSSSSSQLNFLSQCLSEIKAAAVQSVMDDNNISLSQSDRRCLKAGLPAARVFSFQTGENISQNKCRISDKREAASDSQMLLKLMSHSVDPQIGILQMFFFFFNGIIR